MTSSALLRSEAGCRWRLGAVAGHHRALPRHHRGRLALTANVTLFSPAAAEAMTLAGINAPALWHPTEHAHALLRFKNGT